MKHELEGTQTSYWKSAVVIATAFSVGMLLFGPIAFSAVGVPEIISHQGRLLDSSGNLLGGTGTDYCFKFSIWDNPTVGSGSKIWPSGSPSEMTVEVTNGVFNVGIGDTSAGGDTLDFNFEDNDTVYLNVEVAEKAGTCGAFDNLSPRQRIYSSGYAINANTLRGWTASQSASGNKIPVLTNGDLILGDTNPSITATLSNTLTLQGGGATGNLQFFDSNTYLTSAGYLTLAGGASISGNVDPGTDLTYSLGQPDLRWLNTFTYNASVSNVLEVSNYASISQLFATNASVSNNFEVSNIASISQLFIGGQEITANLASNLDFDDFIDSMTLDANLSVASGSYTVDWEPYFISDLLPGLDITYSLGDPTHRWLSLFVNNASVSNNLEVTNNFFSQYASISEVLEVSNYASISQLFAEYASITHNFEVSGYASISQLFANYASISENLEVSNYASISQLFASYASISGDLEVTNNFFTQYASISEILEVSNYASISQLFAQYASISQLYATYASNSYLEVTNIASISQLFIGGTEITGTLASDLDFDDFLDSMTLDANLSVASAGFTIDWDPYFISDLLPGLDITYSLGDPTHRWLNIFAQGASLSELEVTNYASISQLFAGNASVSNNLEVTNNLFAQYASISEILEVSNYASISQLFAYYASNSYLEVTNLASISQLFIGGTEFNPSGPTSLSATVEITGDGTALNHLALTDSSSGTTTAVANNDGDFQIRFASASGAFGDEHRVFTIASNSLTTTIGTPASPSLAGTYDTAGTARDVYISGRYAYVADTGDLRIIDISNPASPSQVGSYTTPGTAYGLMVAGRYAYIGDNTNGLQIVDVSDPSSPVGLGSYTIANAYDVYVSGRFAYVTDSNAAGDLFILDISDPNNPTLVSQTSTGGRAYRPYAVGNYVYIANHSDGLKIIDVTDPYNPSIVHTYDTPGSVYDVYVSGKHAYVADAGSGLRIIDISDPSSPSFEGVYDTPSFAFGVEVNGRYAYVSDFGTVEILDVSDPTSPTKVGHYTTPGSASQVRLSGRYAYVADQASGLQILDIGGLETHALYAGNVNTSGLSVLENVDIGNSLYVRNNANIGPGGLQVQGFSTFASGSWFGAGASFSGDVDPTADISYSLGQPNLRWLGLFAQNASISNNLEVSNYASISQLFVGGTEIAANMASNLDFDDFLDAMTLDANTTVASNGFSLDFNTGDDTNLYIGDRIGIGTTVPAANLDVALDSNEAVRFFTSGAGTLTFQAQNAALGNLPVMSFGTTSGGAEQVIIGDTTGDGLIFNDVTKVGYWNFKNNTNNSRLYIDRDGVGILETSPDARLEIVGSASRPYFYLSSTAGGDGDIFTVDSNGLVTFGSFSGNFDPSADDTYDLGESATRWRDLYLGPGSIHIGTAGDEASISYDTTANSLDFRFGKAGDSAVLNADGSFIVGDSIGIARSDQGGLVQNYASISYNTSNRFFLQDHTGAFAKLQLGSVGSFFGGGDFFVFPSYGTFYTETNTLGIGTTTPVAQLDIDGDTSTILRVASNSNQLFAVYETGHASLSGNFELTGTVSSNLVPTLDDTFTLGSPSLRWADIFLGSGSIHIGTAGDEASISYDTTNDRLAFRVNGRNAAFLNDDGTFMVADSIGLSRSDVLDAETTNAALRASISFNSSGTIRFTGAGFNGITSTRYGGDTYGVSNNYIDFDGNNIEIVGVGVNSATYDALVVNTNNAVATAGATLLSLQNNGTEMAFVDWKGLIYAGDSILSSNSVGFGLAGSQATTSYSRFGTGSATAGWISSADDLLLSNDLQVLGSGAFGGNVGIASSSPLYPLSVEGDTRIDGSAWIGNGEKDGFSESAFDYAIQINHSADALIGGAINADYEVASGSTALLGWGGDFLVTTNASRSASVLNIVGGNNRAFHYGSGAITRVYGASATAANQAGGGTVSELYGLNVQVNNYGSTVTDAKGIFIAAPGSAANITDLYGLYVGSQGTASKQWNIYSAGAGTHNYFAGHASIGGNLEVTGFASVSSLYGASLSTCTSAQKLQWNSGSGTFSCVEDQTGGGGGSALQVREFGVFDDATVSSISFEPGHFALSASSAADVIVRLDWGAGGPASLSQNETATGVWTFSNGASVGANLEISGIASIGGNALVGNRIGVGTITAPQTLIQAQGAVGETYIDVKVPTSAGSGDRFGYLWDTGLYGNITADPDSSNGFRVSRANSSPMVWGVNSLSVISAQTFTEQMRMTTGGNLGIYDSFTGYARLEVVATSLILIFLNLSEVAVVR